MNAPGGAGLSIGNALRSGGLSCNGEIDDVKIWRLNPRRFDDEFYSRPMDRGDGRMLEALPARDRRGVSAPPGLRKADRQRGSRRPSTVSFVKPTLKDRRRRAGCCAPPSEYNRLWRAGKVDSPEMVEVFVDLIGWLRIAGIAPEDNAALAALSDSALLAVDPRRADAARLRSPIDGAVARGRRQPR